MPNALDISEGNWFKVYDKFFKEDTDNLHGVKTLPDISGCKFIRILFDAG
ncbi:MULTISPECIES: hypothetical protein [Oscillatoriales]|uniref:Transposase n=1 Tax=Limnospira platensis NIES-46 TaxID=1236695 RepID=A0A5M3TB08_LIMPL|nr:hypothetical protein [Arthrospira platensis NCB002]MDT9313727.1 hypothetical protein [Limnospira sp. Paracas R14]QQW27126.1 hypothetical protein AP9108_17470 [Arthrospira sp. PCC 9108]BAI91471.1 hypothetical protein NIES39_J04240 [Arthrospira platensis NIES-39]GCE96694.1 hypothetical protein NIES46_47660 [Arthrospira platensis NIES-46]